MARHPLPAPLLKRIPLRVRQYRQLAALTQDALAEKAGIKVATLSRIERGRMQPSIAMLWRLAQALERSMGDFLDEGPAVLDLTQQELELVQLWRCVELPTRESLHAVLMALRGQITTDLRQPNDAEPSVNSSRRS